MLRSYSLMCLSLTTLLVLTGCQKKTESLSASVATASSAATSDASSASAEPAEVNGMPVVHLKREQAGTEPQFVSATILPGRGMNVFKIHAYFPGLGVIPVIDSPSLAVANSQDYGTAKDAYGDQSFTFGGAFLTPYPNRVLGKLSADGKTITTYWEGHKLVLPANWHNSAHPDLDKHAMHGLILKENASNVVVRKTPEGEVVTADMKDAFGNHWLSKTDLHFQLTLAADVFDAQVTATNVGKQDEPISIAWHPYLTIPSGEHAQTRLSVPATMHTEVNNYQDVFPTGKLTPVKGTRFDFNTPEGRPLADGYLDDNWSHLERKDGKVVVSIFDPASGYGVSEMGLSPQIRTLQVYSPPTAKFVVVEQQFNFADPFGKEWHGMDTGMVTLKPGQSVTWHVQLKLFKIPKS